jgi:hypothetical protein
MIIMIQSYDNSKNFTQLKTTVQYYFQASVKANKIYHLYPKVNFFCKTKSLYSVNQKAAIR